MDWFIDGLIDWWIDWLIDWLIDYWSIFLYMFLMIFFQEALKKTRDYCRSPMQWNSNASTNAGFTTAAKPWLPLAPGFDTGINVQVHSPVKIRCEKLEKKKKFDSLGISTRALRHEIKISQCFPAIFRLQDQSAEPTTKSHYNVFRDLIRIRRTPAFQSGQFRAGLVTDDVYSFIRESGEQTYLIAIDLRRNGTASVAYDFTAPAKLTGVGRVVTASVHLYPKNGEEAEEGSIASYGKDRDVPLNSVHLTPASAVVLRVTKA